MFPAPARARPAPTQWRRPRVPPSGRGLPAPSGREGRGGGGARGTGGPRTPEASGPSRLRGASPGPPALRPRGGPATTAVEGAGGRVWRAVRADRGRGAVEWNRG